MLLIWLRLLFVADEDAKANVVDIDNDIDVGEAWWCFWQFFECLFTAWQQLQDIFTWFKIRVRLLLQDIKLSSTSKSVSMYIIPEICCGQYPNKRICKLKYLEKRVWDKDSRMAFLVPQSRNPSANAMP